MKTVLFVDEEKWYMEPILIYFQFLFPKSNYLYAKNGIQAMDALQANNIDCVVLDIMMPYGTPDIHERFAGLIVLENLKTLFPELPIICYTARDEKYIIDKIKSYKHTEFLSKGESEDLLWNALRKKGLQ